MRLLFILVGMILSINALADGLKSLGATKDFASDIVALFIQGKFSEGLSAAKPYWPIPETEINSLADQINQKLPIVSKRYGKTVGKEFIRSEAIGKSFIRYVYLHKFENHAGYWQIDFYKSRSEWKINSITFLDSLDILYTQ
jgi:hypothetical protein